MWTCAKCGEAIEDQFDSCWKCAVPPEPPPRPVTRRWKVAVWSGIFFECVLVALCVLLPTDSALFPRVYNFAMASHYPLLRFVETLPIDSAWLGIPLMLVIGLVMALFWAVMFCWGFRLVAGLLDRLGLSRRQKVVLGYSAGFIGAVILALAVMDAGGGTATSFTATPEVKAVVEGNTAFALDLYQKLAARPGNLFFSPYSISTALAMTYAGARGRTESEMARALHFSVAQTNLHTAFGDLAGRMKKVQRWNRITLLTANSLWCQKDYPFTDAFLNLARTGYQAEARLVDFKHAPQEICGDINAWVERRTNGKIKGMTEPSQLTPDTSLILCNAIYFKGKWATQFKPAETKPAPFSIATNETVTVPMMYQTAEFKITHLDDEPAFGLLELPYYGRDLSMVILLPEAVDGLGDLERQLTVENLHAWLAKLDQARPHKTSVHLPRFNTTQSFDLVSELKSLGMPTAFDVRNADFSGIDGVNYLYLSSAIHKAFVEVNEAGTEAAATTLLKAKSRSMTDRFTANHPFLFLIRENGSGSILFIGRIVDPTK